MKKLVLLATLSAGAFAVPALAQSDFSGPYIGAQAGYNSTEIELSYDDGTTSESASDDFGNGAFGVFAGANAQSGNMVYGIEADLNYNDANQEYEILDEELEVGIDYSGAIRGRIGYAMNNTLVYGALGVAGSRAYVEYGGEKETETMAGWTAGVGVDYAFSDNVFGRAEYRYVDYGETEDDFAKAELSQQSVWLGVAMKF